MLQIYSILTAVLALTGCASLIISGEVNPIMSITGLGLFPGYYRFLRGSPHAPGWVVGGFSVLTLLVFFFDTLIVSKDYFLGVAHLTIAFQTIKSFDLKEPWDHLQVYFMSLLQLTIASELTHSVAFGVIFIFFLIALVAAIVLAHFMKEGTIGRYDVGKPVAYISLLALLVTGVLFVAIPRVSGGIWGKSRVRSIRSVGFSERVDLGSFGAVKLDPTVVMRVEMNPMITGPYYWRGMTLDYFDGRSWDSALINVRRSVKKIGDEFVIQPFSGASVLQKIMLEPIDSDVLFGLDRVVSVDGDFIRLEKNPAMSLFIPRKGSRRLQYTVGSNVNRDAPSSVTDFGTRDIDLTVPAFLRDKIKTLADEVLRSGSTKPLSDLQKAEIIEKYLKKNYRYSLDVSLLDDTVNPILYFLFESKTGYCEHYASAMVLMLRSTGIPARIVTGFYGGELNEFGNYIIVRQSNAHSWVEAAVNGRWTRFDPTPSVSVERPPVVALFIDMLKMKWDRYVVAFSFSDQKEIVRYISLRRLPRISEYTLHGFRSIVGVLILLLCAGVVIFFLRRARVRKYGFVTVLYLRLKKLVKNKGGRITWSSTSDEVRREAVKLRMDSNVEKFIELYEEYRFGGREMAREDRDRYQKLLADISRSSK